MNQKRYFFYSLFFIFFFSANYAVAQNELTFEVENAGVQTVSKDLFKARNSLIQYYGRIQNDLEFPRFWMPGVYIKIKFEGNICSFFINDQVLYGNVHNYLEVVVDGKAYRFQTKFAENKISINGLKSSAHTITICKDTEAGNGYIEFAGIACKKLLPLPSKPTTKIEFIGNSITCGYGDDPSEIACGKGEWYDKHNAYMAYGPLTARALNAQWHLSSVSGIGMIHSCCGMKILMPQVFDKVDMRDDSIAWNFKEYVPDLVTICLGQNDGIQDSIAFCSAYVDFVNRVRSKYPKAKILLLSSPMADVKLRPVLVNYLTSIKNYFQKKGDKKIYDYFFQKQYSHGCDGHPDVQEHKEISGQLVRFIKENKLG